MSDRNVWRWFRGGVISAIAGMSLWQDGLGQERYLEVVRSRWTTGWVTVPLALALLAFVVASLVAEQRDHARAEKFKGWRWHR